jgi:hypothetical protein
MNQGWPWSGCYKHSKPSELGKLTSMLLTGQSNLHPDFKIYTCQSFNPTPSAPRETWQPTCTMLRSVGDGRTILRTSTDPGICNPLVIYISSLLHFPDLSHPRPDLTINMYHVPASGWWPNREVIHHPHLPSHIDARTPLLPAHLHPQPGNASAPSFYSLRASWWVRSLSWSLADG